MMKTKKYDYYSLDVGFFPNVLKLCFDDKVFQQILKDQSITLKANALDSGVAETHHIGDGKQNVIILVFNLNEIGNNIGEIFDTIAHEVSHSIDHLADFIGESDGIKGETRAYLTGSLVKQIFVAYELEKQKRARKTSRGVSKQKGQGGKGPVVQVDQLSVGGTGQNCYPSGAGVICGAQDDDWQTITATDYSLFDPERTGF